MIVSGMSQQNIETIFMVLERCCEKKIVDLVGGRGIAKGMNAHFVHRGASGCVENERRVSAEGRKESVRGREKERESRWLCGRCSRGRVPKKSIRPVGKYVCRRPPLSLAPAPVIAASRLAVAL